SLSLSLSLNSDFSAQPYGPQRLQVLLLKTTPRIASVRIFHPNPMLETEFQLRVLTSQISPNGSQEPAEVGEKLKLKER
ncbi:unnamed protein product, partial [Prunus brigantina]